MKCAHSNGVDCGDDDDESNGAAGQHSNKDLFVVLIPSKDIIKMKFAIRQ